MVAVTDIINDSREYASNWVNQADQLMTRIGEISGLTITTDTVPDRTYATYVDQVGELFAQFGTFPTKPNNLSTLDEVLLPDVPDAPDFSSIGEVSIPTFTGGSAPTINIPAAPSVDLPDAPGAAPEFVSPAIPESPDTTMPEVPGLTAVVLPDLPTFEFPEFDATAPSFEIPEPSNNFEFAEEAYASELLDALKVQLLNDLTYGGYGINPDDEAAIWARAAEREAQTANAAIEEAEQAFASRGFMVPPGALFAAIEGAQARAQQAMNSLSRDVALKRADLYVQNRQFTVQQVQQLESVLINYHMAVMERFLNAAKATAQFAVDFYQAQLAGFKSRLEAWQTEAQVFGEKVRAVAQKVEIFKAQLQAAQTTVDIDKARVDLYRSQLAGVEAVVNLYRVRMDAAQTQAQIEKMKLDAYRSTVDAYVATVQAKNAEFGMYETRIKGETAKLAAFETSVKAYTAQMEGARIESDVLATKVKREVEQSTAAIRTHELRLEDAKVRAGLATNAAELKLKEFGYDVDAYKTRVSAVTEYGRLALQNSDQNLKAWSISIDANLKRATWELEKLKTQFNHQLEAGVKGASIYADMVKGALGAINSISTLSE